MTCVLNFYKTLKTKNLSSSMILKKKLKYKKYEDLVKSK